MPPRWLAPLAETVLSDDDRDFLIDLAECALVRAKVEHYGADFIARLGGLLADLGGNAILIVRKPAEV